MFVYDNRPQITLPEELQDRWRQIEADYRTAKEKWQLDVDTYAKAFYQSHQVGGK
jgi:hypothetical protein